MKCGSFFYVLVHGIFVWLYLHLKQHVGIIWQQQLR